MPAVGFEEKTKYTELCVTIRRCLPIWQQWWELAFFTYQDQNYGRSMHSQVQRKTPLKQWVDVDQEYWFSTRALLILFCGWRLHRRPREWRQVAHAVFLHILEACCPRDALASLDITDVSDRSSVLCSEVADGALCIHLQRWLDLVSTLDGHCIFRKVADAVSNLFTLSACGACGKHLGDLAMAIADIIDSSTACWDDTTDTPENTEGIWLLGRNGKRRRADPHIKFDVQTSKDTLSNGGGTAALLRVRHKASKLSTSQWPTQWLSQVQAACHLTARTTQVFHSALDASKLGEPALEVLLHLMWSSVSRQCLPLPPQVFPSEGTRVVGFSVVKTEFRKTCAHTLPKVGVSCKNTISKRPALFLCSRYESCKDRIRRRESCKD